MVSENQSPKISVVLPTWNRGYCVGNAISSILMQDFDDFELIVVDDGSTDNTASVVGQFNQNKIRYFRIPKTNCVSETRNLGNSKAVGELIVVQDSDDFSCPDRLKRIWKEYKGTGADVIYHDVYIRFVDDVIGCIVMKNKEIGEYERDRILNIQYIPGQIAYKRSAWEKIPYENSMKTCDDMMLLLEFALNNLKFAYINRPLYIYDILKDSLNIQSEIDGRRFEDAKTMVRLLKERYDYAVVGEIKKWDAKSGQIYDKKYI